MRRIRYQVASSLDGYIAGPQGDYGWIIADPDIDFAAHFQEFDTLLMGRRTFEMLPRGSSAEQRVIVVSRTLDPAQHRGVTIINDGLQDALSELREEPGKDIWLFGGGETFRSLLRINQVDTVELAIIPVLLGGGVPLLPTSADRKRLQLSQHRVYPKSGIVSLRYNVVKQSTTKKTRQAKRVESSK